MGILWTDSDLVVIVSIFYCFLLGHSSSLLLSSECPGIIIIIGGVGLSKRSFTILSGYEVSIPYQ
jgi:hypothetical protein